MSLKFKRSQFLYLLLLCLMACNQSDLTTEEHTNKKYSIYVLAKDGKEYILETNSLSKGELKPELDGANVSNIAMSRAVIVKNGFYYHLDRKNEQLVKYQIHDKQLKKVAAMPLKDFSIENFYWKSTNTLLLTGLNAADFSQVKYVMINTDNMQQIAGADLNIPRPTGRFDNMSVGFVDLRGQQLFVGYTYHDQLSAANYTTSDTTYVTEFNFPLMTVVKSTKDTRSTYPGGINTIQPYSFNDEEGNYYFMTCPGIALGNRPELPTAIMQIKSGSDSPDQSYFFNLTGLTHNHAYGLWYLGNNKAIIRSERKDLFKGLSDHYSTPHFEFYVIDLISKSLQKLNLPLDKGTRRQCVIVNKDDAYISVNSPTEGNYIWIYNKKSGELKKGLQLSGDTDFILRIDELSPYLELF